MDETRFLVDCPLCGGEGQVDDCFEFILCKVCQGLGHISVPCLCFGDDKRFCQVHGGSKNVAN